MSPVASASDRVRVHVVVDLERMGPSAERSAVVTALLKQVRSRQVVWAGLGVKQTAYKVIAVDELKEEASADVR